MIVLDILSNGIRVCRASVGEHGTVLAAVTWRSAPSDAQPPQREQVRLTVGGTSSLHDGYIRWAGQHLAVGDRITIQVIEVEDAEALRAPSTVDGTAA